MAEEDKGKVFILLGILSLIVLIPLLRAKPLEELDAEIISTKFERINN